MTREMRVVPLQSNRLLFAMYVDTYVYTRAYMNTLTRTKWFND